MDFEDARQKALAFRDERDWAQFHNPKDLAISLSLESSELLELFQWSGADLDVSSRVPEMADELADVVVYAIFLADKLGIDLSEAVCRKLDEDARKYPVSKACGTSRKYTQL
jgi:NTP pyrophosphatase (non-canonical NTP hydrolase)